jgi:hypothetical protein
MSISEINIIVFPTLLYSQGDTEILRDLLVWKYLQLNNSTFNSISSEDLEIKEEDQMTSYKTISN